MGDIKYAIEIFREYGYTGIIMAIIILLTITLSKGSLFKSTWSWITEKFVERFMREKTKDSQNIGKYITESDIVNHDVFNYIDLWRYSRIPAMQFSTEYRTVVFRKYLTIFLKSYKTNLIHFLSNSDYKEMDDAEMWKNFLNLINHIVYDYERECEEIGIPKIVIEKMKVRNNDTITLIIDLIEGICNSHFYESENNYLKVYSILNIILSVLENTIQNSESVCNSINGALSGLSINDGGKTVTEP
jgi:hypothetical protein